MNATSRRVLRGAAAIAAALLAAGALAAPAYADTTADLEVKLGGATVFPGTEGNYPHLSVINHGPADATGVIVTFDLSDVDTSRVEPYMQGCKSLGDQKHDCNLGFTVWNGEDADLPVFLSLQEVSGAPAGPAGSVTVSVRADGTDPDLGNNVATAQVAIGSNGVDLGTYVPDIAFDVHGDLVLPGSEVFVLAALYNSGDMTASGIKMTIELPRGVTFTEPEPECTHAAGDRTTVCDYKTVSLGPSGFGRFFFPALVDEAVASPSALTGGVITAEAMAVTEPEIEAQGALPKNFSKQDVPADADFTDNSDDFTVFVADTSGGGGGLPVTGAQVGLISGAGAAVLVLGVVLFVAARRRRVTITDSVA